MPPTLGDLKAFAEEVRRLEGEGEPPLYPAYKALLETSYPSTYAVDCLLRAPGAGFPDLTVSNGPRLVNWIEVKHPSVSIDPLPPPDAERFNRYREALPHIVLTNGWMWLLFEGGTETARTNVPKEWLLGTAGLSSSNQSELIHFFEHIAALSPAAATTDVEAVHLLATSARLISQAVLDMADSGLPGSLSQARTSFTELLQTNPADPSEISVDDFADALAQTCTFGYLLARIEAGKEVDPNTAVSALDTTEHPFLKATLHAVVGPEEELEAALSGVLRTACDAVNAAALMLAGPDGDWKKVPYVYEDFFAEYRPNDRFKYGVFYTREEITHFQVQEIRASLVEEFGLTGLTDPKVRYLEPACGTGTYLLALAEEALLEAQESGMPVPSTLQELFRDRVVAFDVSPGPASVAQARLTAWLRARGVSLGARFPVYTVNTLKPPATGAVAVPGNLWAENISKEQQAGDEMKRDKPVLVIFGNPPWGDRPRDTFDVHGLTGPSKKKKKRYNLIAEWAKGASGAVINLYDLYVAFWRFALALLLERPDVQSPQGIVSYITNRSWLRGKAYNGMRAWLRKRNVTAEIVDLGGDIRAGARADDEPIFAIKAGSAIATLTFGGKTSDKGARVSLRRLRGSRQEKLNQLRNRNLPEPVVVEGERGYSFGLIDWGSLAAAEPIDRFFVANFPGVKTHRDNLVIDVNPVALLDRIRAWNFLTGQRRQAEFHNTSDRQAPPEEYTVNEDFVVNHRYRPLDDRFLYADRPFIDRPGKISKYYKSNPSTPSLITMDTRTSAGPIVIACASLPGYNSFRGSYETHVYPLWPLSDERFALGDAEVLSPSAKSWADMHGASAVQVGAYLLALGNAPSYADAFQEALEVEIVRFPATKDTECFKAAADVGHRLLEAWALKAPPLGTWSQVATDTPLGSATMEGDTISFENGDRLEHVHPLTFELSVSSYPVMQRYLEARAHLPLTVALAEEIQKVAGSVAVILDACDDCDLLLQRAIEAPAVSF